MPRAPAFASRFII